MKGIQLRKKKDDDDRAEVLIYDDIGEGFFTQGITAKAFHEELKSLGTILELDIRINSNGGSVFDGIAIYNALRRFEARKTVYVDGIAASIASVVAMAGDTIQMGEGTWFMVHDPSALVMGASKDMRDMADLLDGIKRQIVDIYQSKTGLDDEKLSSMMSEETWLNPQTAVELGFATAVVDKPAVIARAAAGRFRHTPQGLLPVVPLAALGEPACAGIDQSNIGVPNMSKLQELQAQAHEHKSAADGIVEKANAEKRQLTQPEIDTIQNHMSRFDLLKTEMELLNRMTDAEDWLAQSSGPKVPRDGLMNTSLPTAQERGRWGFKSFGDYAQAIRLASTTNQLDPRLIQNATASTYGTEGTGADGGFAVPPEYKTDIQSLVLAEDSILMSCDAVPTSSNRVTVTTDESTAWQSSGGILTYWGGEAGTMTQSKPALKEINVQLHKLYALVPVTDELLEDAPMLGSFLTTKAAQKIAFAVTNAIITGSGQGQPYGILNAPATVSVAKEGSQGAATLIAANVLKMATRMLSNSFQRAVWLVNQDTIQALWQMNITFQTKATGAEIAAGTRFPTITLPGENGNTFSTMMGRPIIVTEACKTLGTVGDIILADLKGYFAPYKAAGIRGDVSMHLWFDQGLQAFRWTFRVGGQPWLSAAVSPLNSSNTLSTFVTLATR